MTEKLHIQDVVNDDSSAAKTVSGKCDDYYSYWNKWSKKYDIVTTIMYLPFGGERRFRRSFVKFGGLRHNDIVLDLCAGTGSVTREIADILEESGHVTALDLSPHMLVQAQKKLDKKVGKGNANFVCASADELPFTNQAFDKVFVSYGLHELPDEIRRATLKEVWRVLKNGGSFVILDYNKAKNPIMRLGINIFVKWREEKSAWRMLCNNPLPAELKQIGFKSIKDNYPIGGVFRFFHLQKPLDASNNMPEIDIKTIYACANRSCKECGERICVYSREDVKHRPNVKE
ncbi:MAG: class I SAM-dependent methyltransferase [Chloroflexi bacterium]|nr:class I SAM-dependent methyltransferase [Chloroflexota bacterium]